MNTLGFRYVKSFDVQPPKNGACIGYPTEWWFPKRVMNTQEIKDMNTAKEICASCAVQKECLDYAIEAHEEFGIWGGMAPGARDIEIRRRKRDGTYVEPRRIIFPN